MVFFNNVEKAFLNCVSNAWRDKLRCFVLLVPFCCLSMAAYAYSLPQQDMRSTSIMRSNYVQNAYKPQNVRHSINKNMWNGNASRITPIHVGSAKRYKVHSYGNGYYYDCNNYNYAHRNINSASAYNSVSVINPQSLRTAADNAGNNNNVVNKGGYMAQNSQIKSVWGYEAATNYLSFQKAEIVNYGDYALRRFMLSIPSIDDEFTYWKQDFYQWLLDNKGKDADNDGYTYDELVEWWEGYEWNPGDGTAPNLFNDFIGWLPIGNELWILLLMAMLYCFSKVYRKHETNNINI